MMKLMKSCSFLHHDAMVNTEPFPCERCEKAVSWDVPSDALEKDAHALQPDAPWDAYSD